MLPHGPDVDAFTGASAAELRPRKLESTMAFMFETCFMQRVTEFAANHPSRQTEYQNYGANLRTLFDPARRGF